LHTGRHRGEASLTSRILKGPSGFGDVIVGEALVSTDAFSPRYDLDRDTGIVSRQGHAIEGRSVVGKVLIIPTAKGGVAAGWAFYDLKTRGLAPLAIVCRSANPVFVQGCVLAGIPIIHRCLPTPDTSIRTGDRLRIDPRAGIITVVLER